MYSYQSDELTKQDQYKLLSSSIVPRAIAWIMTKNQTSDVLNLAPFSFFSGASNEEPLVTLTVFRDQGKMKDTAVNLVNQQEGVIHITEEFLLEKMNETARRLPPEVSELDYVDLTLVDSQTVSVPGIEEANIRLEVKLHQYVPIKSSTSEIVSDLFILKVSAFHLAEKIFDPNKKRIKLDAIQMVGRLAGPYYGIQFNKIVHLERP